MKKKTLIILSATLALLVSVTNSYSQNNSVIDVNAQLRALFSPLLRPVPSKWFLYDMSAKMSDTVFYQTHCKDTVETDMWYKIYEEMYHAAYDTVPMPEPDTVFTHGNGFNADTIPMGIMNYAFYKFRDDALTTNTYFNFDTVNTILTDKFPRPGWPYLDSNMFVAAPMVPSCHFTNPVYRVDPQFIFYDAFNAGIYSHGGGTLKIDFGDGNGWIQFNPTIVTHWAVQYSSNGEKIIQTAIFNSHNQIIFYSQSRIFVISATASVAPDQYLSWEGLTGGLYSGCHASGLSGKLVIYLSGFDLMDFIPSQNRTVSDIYSQMITNDKIVQLKNDGYSFLVIDWNNSRVDIRFNALYLVNLLEDLKCRMDVFDMFVIMGESMGGLVGRYALTYMESEYYMNQITTPFFVDALDVNNIGYLAAHPNIYHLPVQWCHTDKMHNTRLFITLDTPHQGANVPMSIQYAYRTAMNIFGSYIGFSIYMTAQALNLFLEGQAAQQMLISHIDNKYGSPWYWDYGPMPDKDNFFQQLGNLGNYPRFAKVVAMSNGSLHGENQTNYYLNIPRQPNDRLIDFRADLHARILGFRLPIFGGDLECFTNPNGNGHIFTANAGWYSIRIKLKWFGVKIHIGYVGLIGKSEDAHMLPYCTSAGGWIGDVDFVNPNASSNGYNLANNSWILNLFHYNHTVTGNGCVTFDSHLGLNGFLSTNFDYSLCSDGLHFGFVPLQSALDYGTLGSIPLNHDIEGEVITTKLSQVNADVIIGYPGKGIYLNRGHVNFRNDYILNLAGSSTTYYSCMPVDPQIERGMLNLEIGDEELYLENVTLPWTADYHTEFDIHVNERNPHYQYPSQSSAVLAGIYSKEDPYIIGWNGLPTFHYDMFNSPTHIGLSYSPPFTNNYNTDDQPQTVCCTNFLGHRLAPAPQISQGRESFLNAFPDPNDGRQLTLSFHFKDAGQAHIELTNLLGEKVYSYRIYIDDETIENKTVIDLGKLSLSDGLYIVRMSNENEIHSTKLIISK